MIKDADNVSHQQSAVTVEQKDGHASRTHAAICHTMLVFSAAASGPHAVCPDFHTLISRQLQRYQDTIRHSHNEHSTFQHSALCARVVCEPSAVRGNSQSPKVPLPPSTVMSNVQKEQSSPMATPTTSGYTISFQHIRSSDLPESQTWFFVVGRSVVGQKMKHENMKTY